MKDLPPWMIIVLMVSSIGLIVISDLPLQSKLGEHPLQSELVFVEGHVQTAKIERQERARMQEQQDKAKEKEQSQFIFAVVGCSVLLGLLVIGALQVIKGLKLKKQVEAPIHKDGDMSYGIIGAMGLVGVFLLILGGVYFSESHRGVKQMYVHVQDVTLKKKQKWVRSPKERERDRLVMDIYQRDRDRGSKGFLIGAFGLLICMAAAGTSHFKRNA